jgi:hypothetical protein
MVVPEIEPNEIGGINQGVLDLNQQIYPINQGVLDMNQQIYPINQDGFTINQGNFFYGIHQPK